jgi:hypothetical protein
VPNTISRDGDRLRIDWPNSRAVRLLAALPLLAGSGYLFYYVAFAIREAMIGRRDWHDDLTAMLVFAGVGLVIGGLGLVAALFRYWVSIDQTQRQVTIVRQIGPLAFRRVQPLARFDKISVAENYTEYQNKAYDKSYIYTYDIALCGSGSVRPIELGSFAESKPAEEFARDVGLALNLPVANVIGQPPDDPDLVDAPEVPPVNKSRGHRHR